MTRAISTSFIGAVSLLLLVGCYHQPIPKWFGKVFIGNSDEGAIVRNQDNPRGYIKATDPAFSNYLCMSTEDFRSWNEVFVLGCASWKAPKKTLVPAEVVVQDLQNTLTSDGHAEMQFREPKFPREK